MKMNVFFFSRQFESLASTLFQEKSPNSSSDEEEHNLMDDNNDDQGTQASFRTKSPWFYLKNLPASAMMLQYHLYSKKAMVRLLWFR